MKMNKRFCSYPFALLLFVQLSCMNSTKQTSLIKDPAAIDAVVEEYVNNGSFPLLYMRIESADGEIAYEHQVVNDSLLPNTNIDGDSWFRIWSMSKIVTICLLLDLVEDGLLTLDDPVVKYIPEFKDMKIAVNTEGVPLANYANDYFKNAGGFAQEYENNQTLSSNSCPIKLVDNFEVMTVEHLINHQAGFYYATTPFQCLNEMVDSKDFNSLKSNEEIIAEMAEMPLIMVPGSDYFYGTNTTVLGFVAERASGKNLQELLNERIKIPLGIEGLRYKLTPEINLLPTFSGKNGSLRFAQKEELDILGANTVDYSQESKTFLGGEGMLGTTKGYAKFLRMLLNHGILNGHRFLDKSTVEQIYSPHTQLENEWGYNGYNLWVSSDKDLELGYGDEGLWRGGGYEQTNFWVDPKRKLVGLIMSQMFEVPQQGHNRDNHIRGAVYKQLFKSEAAPIK